MKEAIVKNNQTAAADVSVEIRKNIKEISPGIIDKINGKLHAPILRILSFAISFRVISYPGCNSLICIALLYRLCKLYSTLRHQKLSFYNNFVLSLKLHSISNLLEPEIYVF